VVIVFIGRIRDTKKIYDLIKRYPKTFKVEILDVTDTKAVNKFVKILKIK